MTESNYKTAIAIKAIIILILAGILLFDKCRTKPVSIPHPLDIPIAQKEHNSDSLLLIVLHRLERDSILRIRDKKAVNNYNNYYSSTLPTIPDSIKPQFTGLKLKCDTALAVKDSTIESLDSTVKDQKQVIGNKVSVIDMQKLQLKDSRDSTAAVKSQMKKEKRKSFWNGVKVGAGVVVAVVGGWFGYEAVKP